MESDGLTEDLVLSVDGPLTCLELICSSNDSGSTKTKEESSLERLQKTHFPPRELILKPKQMKTPKKFTPPEMKDGKYYEFHKKNSNAVRKCREAKERKEREEFRKKIIRLQFLEAEYKRMSDLLAWGQSEIKEAILELEALQKKCKNLVCVYPEGHQHR